MLRPIDRLRLSIPVSHFPGPYSVVPPIPGSGTVSTQSSRHAPRDESLSSIAVSTCAIANLTRSVRATIKLAHYPVPRCFQFFIGMC
jgi:hypothetical protein